MCFYIGIEDLAANAMIEMLKKGGQRFWISLHIQTPFISKQFFTKALKIRIYSHNSLDLF